MVATASLPGKNILCVDDEASMRELLAIYLTRHACNVETATDGVEAWRVVSEDLTKFELIITDNQMPNLGGLDLVERLRGAGFSGGIVFFSSSLAGIASERLSRLQVDAVVEKGSPMTELLAAITGALARSRPAVPAAESVGVRD